MGKGNILQWSINMVRSTLSTRNERGETTSNWFRLLARRAARKVVDGDPGSILDAGCGNGLLFDPRVSILTKVTTLFDISENELKEARYYYGDLGSFVCGNLTRMPFPDGTFNVSVCIGTFYNFPSQELVRQGLSELARVTKPQGRIIIGFRNARNPIAYIAHKFGLKYDPTIRNLPQNPYTISQIKHMLSQASLKIKRIETVGIPVKLLPLILIIEATHHMNDRD